MNYLSSRETAEKWGVDTSFVLRLAREGRIEGAVLFGSKWMLPANAKRPADGRTRAAKEAKREDFFRFPLLLDCDERDCFPPLSEEERQLRRGQLALHACRFEEARRALLPLCENAENRYVRLAALYHRCYLSMLFDSPAFEASVLALNTALAEDFPHRKEMLLLRYRLEADSGIYRSVLEEFSVDADYDYHQSAFYTMVLISLLTIENGDYSLLSGLRYDTYELLCLQMERDGCFSAAQKLHYLLLIVYQLKENDEKISHHIRRGLELAMEHELYLESASYAIYYPVHTNRVLRTMPPDFSKKIRSLVIMLKLCLSRFSDSRKAPSFLNILSGRDYEYAFLANQGYTNRDIARMLKVSEKTVSKKYSEIYDKLGIKTKQELVDMINNTHNGQR